MSGQVEMNIHSYRCKCELKLSQTTAIKHKERLDTAFYAYMQKAMHCHLPSSLYLKPIASSYMAANNTIAQ